jgi:bifunctional NMN adenylyltransferase/nudix hydrolase
MVDNKRVVFYPLRDYPYSNSRWQYQVQHIVEGDVPGENQITLYGNDKDESSFYLKLFPRWSRAETKIVSAPGRHKNLSSTEIRERIFTQDIGSLTTKYLSEANINWLNSWTDSLQGQNILEEKQWVDNFKKPYKDLPYGIIFQTVDCLITWRGLVLLGKRRSMPGKGLWAIPGGYVNQGESLEDAAIRELVEETRTRVYMNTKSGRKRLRFDPSWIVSSRTFDHPSRSRRGRIITTAYHWKIPDHYEILHEADDDLQKTQFFPVNHVLDNMNLQMFEDHQHIVANMLLRH